MILAFASLPRRFVRVTFWKVFPTIAVQRVTTMTRPVTRWTGHVGARRPITRSTAAWGEPREDTEVIDFFAPPRDDFLLGSKPAYMREG
jgi:hypothetical protein